MANTESLSLRPKNELLILVETAEGNLEIPDLVDLERSFPEITFNKKATPKENLMLLPSSVIAEIVVRALSDIELKKLDEVTSKDPREHRADWESAALGQMLEAEREESARQHAERENQAQLEFVKNQTEKFIDQ